VSNPSSLHDPTHAPEPPTGVELSIVIPAYKQGQHIQRDIEQVSSILAKITPDYELIVVIDGCPDDTLAHAREVASDRVRIFGYDVNRGKGYAVRFGFQQASGRVIGFIDAGGDIDPSGLQTAIQILTETDSDLVVGSKRHPDSRVVYPRLRRLYSLLYQILIKILFGFNLTDTQTGLKIFRRAAIIQAIPHMSIDRYAFDVELLAIIQRVGFRKFAESPVDVKLIFPSSVGSARPIFRMLIDTVATSFRVRNILI
jgi:glycosyltransferase involved in cell wall biosynthesis